MCTSKELAWAAGFLEGDGCFAKPHGHRGPYITAGQKQREPLERLQRYFGGTITLKRAGTAWVIWNWNLHGYAGVGLMMTLYKFMSPKRKETIRDALEEWKVRPAHQSNRQTCPQGHPYDQGNTYRHSQGRACRTCRSAYAKTEQVKQSQKEYYQQNRSKKIAQRRDYYNRNREQILTARREKRRASYAGGD